MILAVVESNDILIKILEVSLGVLGIGLILRLLGQPHVIIYIIAGVILGPYVAGVVSDVEMVSTIGNMGLILLLFFIGMEISIKDLTKNWKVSVLGTLAQIILSILAVMLIGYWNSWDTARVITLGFVISLSSTAVILKILQDSGELNTRMGKNVLGILLAQDILIVPMMLILGYLAGKAPSSGEVILQIIGAFLIIGLVVFILLKKEFKLPFHKYIERDHELQLFFSFALCFGFAAATGYFGLSAALGSFVAGIFVSASKTTQWFHDSLYNLKVVFVALFFVSVGMIIDIPFLKENLAFILVIVFIVLVVNNVINTTVMRMFGIGWKESIYAGSMLSQVGEFSFVLGSLAFSNGIISDYAYQLTVILISLTLLISPFWISLTHKIAAKALK